MDKVDELLGIDLTVPEPVFFCSIEPPSMGAQQALEQALGQLQREDQSLRVSQNSETGQTVLAGWLNFFILKIGINLVIDKIVLF